MFASWIALGISDGAIFSSVTFFVAIVVALGFLIGALSGSPEIALFGAFLFYLPIAINSGITIYLNILYLVMTLFTLALAFIGYEFITSGGKEAGV